MYTTLRYKALIVLLGGTLIIASIFLFNLYFPIYSTTAATADLNGYIAQYECRAGNPNCNVDVIGLTNQTCQVTVTTADSSWSKITGDSSKTVYCIQAGDHSSKGTLTLSHSGTASNRKVLRYYRSEDNNDEPWEQSGANQATVKNIVANGSYWIIHRLRAARSDSAGRSETFGNNLFSRMLFENSTIRLIRMNGAGNVLQNSIIRNAGDNFQSNTDQHCVDFGGSAINNIVVNNEIYNCTGDGIQNNSGSNASGIIIENNDIYINSSFINPASSGKACAENAMDIKHPAATFANPVKIIHNRMWGYKRTDTSCGGTGSNGEGIIINGHTGDVADYVLIQNNIFSDMPAAVGINAGDGGNVSIIGNLIYDIYDDIASTKSLKLQDSYKTEVYLNTIIKSVDNWINLNDNGGNDYRCNAVIDSGPQSGSPGSSSQINNNAYYGISGTKPDASKINKSLSTISGSFCTTLGCTSSANTSGRSIGDIVRTTSSVPSSCSSINDQKCFLYQVTQVGGSGQVQAIRGPYAFYRKLQTNPELYIIPYATVHSSAPEQGFCPSSTGSRSGIGINDGAVF